MFVKFVLLSTVASSFIGQAEVTVDGASRKSSGVKETMNQEVVGLGRRQWLNLRRWKTYLRQAGRCICITSPKAIILDQSQERWLSRPGVRPGKMMLTH